MPKETEVWKDHYKKAFVVSNAFKKKKTTLNEDTVPYDVTFEDLKDINCTLTDFQRLEENFENEIASKTVVKSLVDKIAKQFEEEDILVCAQNLYYFSKEIETKKCNIKKREILESVLCFYNKEIVIHEEKIIEIYTQTVAQSDCLRWFEEKIYRISSSLNPHLILTTKKSWDQLIVDILTEKKTDSYIKNLEYGKKNEKNALIAYTDEYNATVVPAGLFINPNKPYLCASPDGIVIEDGCIKKLLEIKSPSSCANKPIYDVNKKVFNVSYLCKDQQNNTYLKESDKYYTQVQMQMYVCGLSECDFFVWCPSQSEKVTVQRDEKFLNNILPLLENFYFKYYLKSVMQKNQLISL